MQYVNVALVFLSNIRSFFIAISINMCYLYNRIMLYSIRGYYLDENIIP